MAVLAVEKVSPYTAGTIYAHAVAVRFNTNQDADLVLVDYTSNPNLHEAARFPFEVDPDMALQVKVPVSMVKNVAEEYHRVFGRDVFLPEAADLRGLNWIPMTDALCLVQAYVKILRRQLHLGGFVQLLQLMGRAEPAAAPFLGRIPRFAHHPLHQPWRARLDGTENVTPERESQNSEKAHSDSQKEDWQDAQVKLERNDHLRDLLQPVESQFHPETQFHTQASQSQFQTQLSQTQFLTQLPLQPTQALALQTPPTQSQPPRVGQNLDQLPPLGQPTQLTQINQLTLLVPLTNSLVPFTLSPQVPLAQRPVPDVLPPIPSLPSLCAIRGMLSQPSPPPVSTRALVVGSFPSDLTMLCTKQYSEINSDLVLSDPTVRPLVLYLADSTDRVLSGANSLAVYVPCEQVAAFCGCKFPEQLYTRVSTVAERFRTRRNVWVDLDLEAAVVEGQTVWTAKTRFDQIC